MQQMVVRRRVIFIFDQSIEGALAENWRCVVMQFPAMARLVEYIGSDQGWLLVIDTFAADHKRDIALLFGLLHPGEISNSLSEKKFAPLSAITSSIPVSGLQPGWMQTTSSVSDHTARIFTKLALENAV